MDGESAGEYFDVLDVCDGHAEVEDDSPEKYTTYTRDRRTRRDGKVQGMQM